MQTPSEQIEEQQELLRLLEQLYPTPKGYNDLSFDIILEIASLLHSEDYRKAPNGRAKSLSQFSLVNVQAREACVPFLFRSITCQRFDSIIHLHHISASRFAVYMQELTISCDIADIWEQIETLHAWMELLPAVIERKQKWHRLYKKATSLTKLLPGLAIAARYSPTAGADVTLPYLKEMMFDIWNNLYQLVLRDLLPKTTLLKVLDLRKADDRSHHAMPYCLLPTFTQMQPSVPYINLYNFGSSGLQTLSSSLRTLKIEYLSSPSDSTPAIETLASILLSVQTTLQSLVIKHCWRQEDGRTAVIDDGEEISQWLGLLHLQIVSFYDDLDDSLPLRLASIMYCPQLLSLSIDHPEYTSSIVPGSALKQLHWDNVDLVSLHMLHSPYSRLQWVKLLLAQPPSLQFYQTLLRSLPQLLYLELAMTVEAEPSENMDVSLVKLALSGPEPELAVLHDRLKHIMVLDKDQSRVGWSWQVSVLRRILPALQSWNGESVA